MARRRRRKRKRRYQLNLRLVLSVVFTGIFLLGGIYFLHKYQMYRISSNLLEDAKEAEVQGDFTEAIKHYTKYHQFHLSDDKVYTKLAILVAEQLKTKSDNPAALGNAYRMLERAVVHDPENLDLIRHFAPVSAKVNRHQAAATHYGWLVKKFPEEVDLLVKLGMSQAAIERTPEAIATFESAISLDKTNFLGYVELAKLYKKIEDKENADHVISQMVTANPLNAWAYVERAKFLLSSKSPEDLELARGDLEEARRLDPRNIEVVVASIELTLLTKDLVEVDRMITDAEKIFPDNTRINELRGNYYEVTHQLDKQIDILSNLERNPKVKFDLIKALIKKGDYAKAQQMIRGIQVQNGYPPQFAAYFETRILIAQHKWDEASVALHRLLPEISRQPDLRLDVNVMLGICYQQLGQIDRQIEWFERALEQDPTLPSAQAGLADGLYRVGKFDEARGKYHILLQMVGEEEFLAKPAWRNQFYELLLRSESLTLREKKMLETFSSQSHTEDPSVVRQELLRVELLLKKGAKETAERLLTDLHGDYPNDLTVWTAMANMKAVQGQPQEGLAVLDEATGQLGDILRLRLAKAKYTAVLTPGSAHRVLADLRIGTEEFSHKEQAMLWHGIGLAYYRMGDKPTTRILWERMAALLPNDLRVRMMLFELAREMNDEKALGEAAAAVDRLPGDHQSESDYCQASRLVWGIQHERLPFAKLDTAKELLERAIKKRPAWHCLPRLDAEIAILEDRYDDAIASFQRAGELAPLNEVYRSQLARLLFFRKRYEEADTVLETLGGRDWFVHVSALEALGQTKEAIELGNKITANSNRAVDFLWFGHLLVSVERYKEAEAAFRRAIELETLSPRAYLALVSLLKRQNKISDAEEVLRQALVQLTEDTAPSVLAKGYQILGDNVRAEQYYQSTVKLRPGDVSVLKSLSQFYLAENRNQDAEPYLRRIIELGESDPAQFAEEAKWSRRALAETLGNSPDWRRQEKGLALLKENSPNGRPSLEDRRLKARIFARRSGRSSQVKAVEILATMLAEEKTLLPEDRFLLARLYLNTNNWKRCREQMIVLVEKHSVEPLYLVAYLRMLLRQSIVSESEVRPFIDRLEQLQPLFPTTLEMKARLLVKLKKPEEAVELLETLLPRPLKDEAAIRNLREVAQLYEELDLIAHARRLLAEYSQKSPDGYIALAQFLGRHGTTDEALDVCEVAMEKSSERNVLPTCLTILRSQPAYVTDEHFRRVDAWIQQAVEKNPNSKSIPLQLAGLRELQGKSVEVIQIYRKFLAFNDVPELQKALVRNNLAYALAASDIDPKEALDAISISIDIFGPRPSLIDTRGLAYLSLKNYPAASADFLQAIADQPTGVKFFHLAQVHSAMGERRNARRNLDIARNHYKLTILKLPLFEQSKYRKLVKTLSDS